MLIYRAGTSGSELGQAFGRLGVNVTLIELGSSFLSKEDVEAAAVLHEQLINDGIEILFKANITNLELLEGSKDHWDSSTLIKVTLNING